MAMLLLLLAAVLMSTPLSATEEAAARERIERNRPNLVTVTSLKFVNRTVTVRASASNVNAAANFVENVKNDPMFTTPEEISISKREEKPPVYELEFKMTIKPAGP